MRLDLWNLELHVRIADHETTKFCELKKKPTRKSWFFLAYVFSFAIICFGTSFVEGGKNASRTFYVCDVQSAF